MKLNIKKLNINYYFKNHIIKDIYEEVEITWQLAMEKVLYTIDEITGLITATVLMRPSKSILDLELKSVKKKWKDKRFAAGVDRDLIEGGAKLLGMELDYIISETIKGMQKVAEDIGLKGEL